MKIKITGYIFSMLLLLTFFSHAQNTWPKIIALSTGGKVTIYQPQPEAFEGNKLTGRAAVSVRKTAKEEPIFGAVFFTAILETDKATRMAELESLSVTNAKFSGVGDQTQVDKLAILIQKEAPKWKLKIAIDDLVASIKKENVANGTSDFNNDPPKILYTNKATTLVVLDGEPQVQKDKDLDAEKVANSPNLIFKEGSQWNMYVGGIWYKSTSVTEGWKQNTSLSAKVKKVNKQIKKQEQESNDGKAVTDKPELTDIIVATEPTELLQSSGEADYQTIEGTSLLYVSNSPNEIFKDINTQKTYVVIAGRWYAAPNINGPWTYLAADKLPADFSKIPEGSEKDGVLANVAGTDAADEAKIDAEIPQTAKVDRKTATITVEYDGAPKFNKVEGTSLQLAENANLTVMIDPGGRYFALDNGVWFVGNSANGPWAVANERPKDVENIPASSPAYNTKYVYIYDQTPDYVYTGYTSGYMGGYVYGPTIVYGTGFRYRPWFGSVYYPRPITWGFGFNYNPWNGWSMNWGFNFGFLHIGFSSGGRYGYGGGWFGPPMYRPPFRPPYWGGGYYGNNRPGYGNNRPGNGWGNRPGNSWGNRPGGNNNINIGGGNNININVNNKVNNLYQNHKGVTTKNIDRSKIVNNNSKIKDAIRNNNRLPNNNTGNNKLPNIKPPVNTNDKKPGSLFNKDNNVQTDREGNIFKKDPKNNEWLNRDNKAKDWKPVTEDKKFKVPDLNKQQNNRERSESRQSNFGRDVPVIKRPTPAINKPVFNRPVPADNTEQSAPSRKNLSLPRRKKG